MNKNKFALILEIVWLIVAVLSLIAGINQTYKFGFKNSILFYIIFLIAIIMYSFRRYLRKSGRKS